MKKLLILLAGAMMPATFAHADNGALQDALTLHFIKQNRWAAVSCDMGTDSDNRTFVYCHPVGDSSFGGVFMVDAEKNEVYPVNGKAIQYTNGARVTLTNGKPVNVTRWTGDLIDVAHARDTALGN